MNDFDDKLETQKQWNTDPCGAESGREHTPGTAAFFRAVESERYGVYAPWMREAIGFGAFGGKKVLEIGPGLGTDHAQFARAGAEMYALDLTARHLDLTRRRIGIEGLTTRAVRADAERLPFSDGTFDAVYSFGVLHHTPGTQAAIGEIHRALRPGGLAIISLYHKHSAFYWICTMLLRGVIRGRLWTQGHRRLLSEIERRSPESEAVPLVKVLSRRECRALFACFAATKIRSDQIDYGHFCPLIPPSTGRSRRLLEKLAHRWGWYLTVFARK